MPDLIEATLIPGDGIGPEIVPASVKILDAAVAAVGAPAINWQELPLGRTAIDTHGTAVPEETLEALDSVDGWLLGTRRVPSSGEYAGQSIVSTSVSPDQDWVLTRGIGETVIDAIRAGSVG